jgi:hypothetical protein
VVSTRVLPLPAPASTSADWCGKVTASNCSGFRTESKEDIQKNVSMDNRAESDLLMSPGFRMAASIDWVKKGSDPITS